MVVTVQPSARRGGYVAILSENGEFKGWGLTPETATLDAFAVWRVSQRRLKPERDARVRVR